MGKAISLLLLDVPLEGTMIESLCQTESKSSLVARLFTCRFWGRCARVRVRVRVCVCVCVCVPERTTHTHINLFVQAGTCHTEVIIRYVGGFLLAFRFFSRRAHVIGLRSDEEERHGPMVPG